MRADVGNVAIEYEVFGPENGEPLVLVTGVFQQLTFWPTAFVDQLTDAGFRVVVHDNRDVGLSTRESRPNPDLATLFGGDVSGVNYTLSDMAADTAGLITSLGYESAHVLGHSMGGGIAQRVAIEFPERVRSLTLFGTFAVGGSAGQSSPEFVALLTSPVGPEPEAQWERSLDAYRICIKPEPVDEQELDTFARRQAERAPNPEMQCVAAILTSNMTGTASSPTSVEELQALTHPALIIHGTGDLAVAFDGAEELAKLIPNAQLVTLDGMGHIPLDPGRWTAIADAVIAHASASAGR